MSKEEKILVDRGVKEAFQELKKFLMTLPLLSGLEPSENLYLYLLVTDQTISSIITKEEGNEQRPYIPSNVLQGLEVDARRLKS